ncbi:hypothetical protein QJQ45_011419 [Haematococcus lacustris]|nr:hypothetical protein QJQ45_011419 [Haematococcus lacustris]
MLGCADVDIVSSCADVEGCICADVECVDSCADVEGCLAVQMSTVSTAVQMSRDASVQMSTVWTAVQMSRDAWLCRCRLCRELCRCRGMFGCADVDCVGSCADVEGCICADVDCVDSCADVEGCICADVDCVGSCADVEGCLAVQMSTVSRAVQMSRDASVQMSTVSTAVQMSRDASVQMSTVSRAVQMSRDASVQMSTVSTAVQMSRDASVQIAVTDSSYERPGLDVKQQQRSASIKEDTLRACFWDDNKAILQLMYPVTQFQVDLQSDTANMADVFYGATAIEMHYGQQAGGAAVGNQDPAALVAHGQLPSLHACLVAAKQPTTPSQSADPALFSVPPHLAGTPVAIALSWLKRQQELQQEKHCQAWLAGSRELLAEAIPLFKARWRYGDSQVLYLAAILDPRYKMLDFQFSPAQFSQAEQALSRLVTVDDSQADQPVAMALEQLRRGWGAPPSELLSRTQLLPIHFAPHLTAHPVKWWAERGGFAPLLQAAAQRVLCIPATAAANERVFSSFKHIWSDKRSSLLLGRMWLLAFIYFNKRVLERIVKAAASLHRYKQEE